MTITATLNGSKTATLTVNPVASFTPVRINSGGPAYTDSLGQLWAADTGYTGGSPYSVTNTITNTSDPTLYKTSRYGASFSYAISAPAGTYSVTLKFAEPVWSAKGKRVFNVAINGTKVLSNFDIFAAAGAEFKAVDKTFHGDEQRHDHDPVHDGIGRQPSGKRDSGGRVSLGSS